MNIIGDKVILRAIESDDNNMLLEIINDAETEYMLGGWSFPVSQKDQELWTVSLKQDDRVLRCTIEAAGKPAGVVILTDIDYKNGNAEVHIKLAPNADFRGKGYGTDAISTVVNYAFKELRLVCIYSRVSSHNIPSQKLFLKCGFSKEGILKSRIYKCNKYIDIFSYSILNTKEV